MPTWKINGYQFYFLSGEPLKKNKPAHIHVRGTKRGKIQFWLESNDTKSRNEVKIKKTKVKFLRRSKAKLKALSEKTRIYFWLNEIAEKIKRRSNH